MRAFLLFTVILISGCMESHRSEERSGGVAAPSTDAMAARAERLQRLHGWGVIELRWTDDAGEHLEQGDLEFWIDGPDRLAVRISKLGDTYIWLGMNTQEAWVFDLSRQPTRLLRESIERLQKSGLDDDPWLTILEMIQLMKVGLGAVPPPPSEDLVSARMSGDTMATYDWRVAAPDSRSSKRSLRMTVNTIDWQPLAAEIRDIDGSRGLILSSPSAKTKRIEIPDVSSLAWPIVSRVIDVQPLEDPGTVAKFAFEGITATLQGQPIDRIFDVDILRTAFRPEFEGSILEMSGEESASVGP
ncbi:MAG: hypothetical protein CMJ40_00100 [Phycisphaerae bacterium]|nr:hypothetical protein [Phycisphaerae bacterium]|tara:strand:+ start:3806 stop:4708 length:903 start_codon:yes stop_codon:yes gene_type:complete